MKQTFSWKYPIPNENVEDVIDDSSYSSAKKKNKGEEYLIEEKVELPRVNWNEYIRGNQSQSFAKRNAEEDSIGHENVGELFIDFHLCANIRDLFQEDGEVKYVNEVNSIIADYLIAKDYFEKALVIIGALYSVRESNQYNDADKKEAAEIVHTFLNYYVNVWFVKYPFEPFVEALFSPDMHSQLKQTLPPRGYEIIEELLKVFEEKESGSRYPLKKIDELIDLFGPEYSANNEMLRFIYLLDYLSMRGVSPIREYYIKQPLVFNLADCQKHLVSSFETVVDNYTNTVASYLSYNRKSTRNPRVAKNADKYNRKLIQKMRKVIESYDNSILKKLYTGDPGKDKCYGFMEIGAYRFFSLSGIFDAKDPLVKNYLKISGNDSRIRALDDLINHLPAAYGMGPFKHADSSLKMMSIVQWGDDDIKYYDNNTIIKLLTAINKGFLPIEMVKRHYSCCERKMFSHVTMNVNNKSSAQRTGFIFVTKEPCDDCKEIIKYMRRLYKFNIYYINREKRCLDVL